MDPLTPKIDTPLRILLATRFVSPLIVCVPFRYWPADIVWSLVVGIYVAADFRVIALPIYVLEIADTVISPVVYVFADTATCADSYGVITLADFLVTPLPTYELDIAPTVIAPVVYLPAFTAVCTDSDGATVIAP